MASASFENRFGGAAEFAAEVDSEYLADDSPELAEAVAYLWFVGGDPPLAASRLAELAGRIHGVSSDLVKRSESMSLMVIEDPEGAWRVVNRWREERLHEHGLALPNG